MAKDKENAEEGGSKKKLIMVIVAVLVLLIGAGVGAFLFLGAEEAPLSPEEKQAQLEKQAKQVGPMVNIDTFIVNILDDQQNRYLKAALTLELSSQEASLEVGERMPQLKDAILLLLSNKTYSELSDLQGKIQLRAELLNKLNSILLQGKIKHIYFTEFVVQ